MNSIIFKVVKEIKCGDEITVFYGQHYFGENNCECKCVTCEKRNTGYYTISSTSPSTITTKESAVKTNTRPTRKRKPPASHEGLCNDNKNKHTDVYVHQQIIFKPHTKTVDQSVVPHQYPMRKKKLKEESRRN